MLALTDNVASSVLRDSFYLDSFMRGGSMEGATPTKGLGKPRIFCSEQHPAAIGFW